MFGLPTSVRIYLAAAPADMRKGFDGLARLVEMHQLDLYSGHLFAFLSRRAVTVQPAPYAAASDSAGFQFAGSNSSIRACGCVRTRTATSRMYS